MSTYDGEFVIKCNSYLQDVKGEEYNIAAAIYRMILQDGNQYKAFQYFLENADDIDSSESQEADEYFRVAEINQLEKKYGKLVEGIIDKLISKHLEEDEFYKELWNKIVKTDSEFEKEEEKIFALYKIWEDNRIPYFKLDDGLKMQNEKFKEIISEKNLEIKKAAFILNSEYDQRTEKSSLLLELIKSCENEQEMAVLLAVILDIDETRAVKNVISILKDLS